jgi:hypothetical protein
MAIKNAPTFKFTVSVHEARVVPTVGTGREAMAQAGQNGSTQANTFEARITQETGTH